MCNRWPNVSQTDLAGYGQKALVCHQLWPIAMDTMNMVPTLESYWNVANVTSGECYGGVGSGGFFVSSSKFIEQHAQEQQYDAAEQKKHISVYGQESNPTTWKLAAMNMAIRGIDFNFGKKNADTFLDNQHPDLRADFVMANPPFNVKDWWSESLADDVRWQYGVIPPQNTTQH